MTAWIVFIILIVAIIIIEKKALPCSYTERHRHFKKLHDEITPENIRKFREETAREKDKERRTLSVWRNPVNCATEISYGGKTISITDNEMLLLPNDMGRSFIFYFHVLPRIRRELGEEAGVLAKMVYDKEKP